MNCNYMQARDAEARGDVNDMQTKSRVALGCNIATVVCWIALNIGVAIAIAIGVTTVTNAARSAVVNYGCYSRYSGIYC